MTNNPNQSNILLTLFVAMIKCHIPRTVLETVTKLASCIVVLIFWISDQDILLFLFFFFCQDVTTREGHSVTLDATISGVPTPKITWYVFKKEIKVNIISLIKLGCREHYYIAIAVNSSGVSQPISMKFGMIDLFRSQSVVMAPKFKISKYVAMEIGIAGFEAPFDHEDVR